MARFFNRMVSEKVQVFWGALQRGECITDAAEAAGTYRKQGTRWVIAWSSASAGTHPAGAVPELRRAGGDCAGPGGR